MGVDSRGSAARHERLKLPGSAALTALAAVFCFSFLVGGTATVANDLFVWLSVILAAGASAFFLVLPPSREAPMPRSVSRLAWTMLALAAFHILPLPPAIWTALPGRELERSIVELVGGPGRWMPLSLRPLDSMKALLTIVPAFAVFLGLTRIDVGHIRPFLAVMLAAIGLSVLIGAVQASSGGALLSIYETQHTGYLLGLFSNRNHHADAILTGYLISCYFARRLPDGRRRLAVWLGLTCGLMLLVAAAASRTGVQLALLATLAALPLFVNAGLAIRRKELTLFLGPGITGVAAMALLSEPGRRLAGRFTDFASDHRLEYWRVARPLLAQYWTTGAGFGAFPPLYMTVEPISVLRRSYVNAAHNDYLQLAIEGGAPALLLLGLFLALLARAAGSLSPAAVRQSDSARLAWLTLCCVILVMLHSAVDYPLRTSSLACAWAAAVAIFFRMAAYLKAKRVRIRHDSRHSIVVAAIALE